MAANRRNYGPRGRTMTIFRLRAFFGCMMFGLIAAGARAEDCSGAITADEALKAEDSRCAAQASNDYDSMQRLFGDDLVYVHSTGAVDDKQVTSNASVPVCVTAR
jgi:hypothetical protein